MMDAEMKMEKWSGLRYRLLSGAVTLLCAVIIVLMRTSQIPSTITVFGIGFPLSDFFIIVGAGLCGYRYGLGLFLIVYVAELIIRQGGLLQSFSLFLYLAVALLSGVIAQRRWYKNKKKTLLAGILLEITLGSLFYVIFAFIFRSSWTNMFQSVVATIPETIVAVLALYMYYRYAGDGLKRSFGIGYLYASDYMERTENSTNLSRRITILSLAESVAFGIISAMLTNALWDVFAGDAKSLEIMAGIGETTLEFSRTMIIISGVLFGWMLSLAVSVIVNEFIVGNIISIVKSQGQLETALAVSEAGSEAKSIFLSSMSHEIRTPINAVLGMDELILRESREETTREYAENIKVAGNTLLGLINDVLDFSKIEAGKMEILSAEYDPVSMLHDLVTMISIRAQKKGLEVKTDISKDIPSKLFGDEIRIKQVITNILTNAVKYTERGSVTLSVTTEKSDDENVTLKVSVRDTGIGIKEEDLGKLFSAFERIEEERNKNIEGTGLGMSITTRLLEMMGSKLEVSSVYGEGSDFSFRLLQRVVSWEPIGDYEKAWKESVKNTPGYRVSFIAPDARILAVDDMPMNLTVFTGLLKQTEVRIDTAESGEECLCMIAEKRYDMIFLDHRMPGIDGLETRQRMNDLEGNLNEDTPVIALTANASAGAKEEYIGYGFSDYLSKPINGLKLEKMIAEYLPKEKVKEAPENVSMDITGLHTDELPQIDGIDWDYARIHLTDENLLMAALKDFYNCIDLHADRLNAMYARLPEDEAFSEYRIQVHGMKSSAATIGIVSLAGMAKRLEIAATDKDPETIRSMNDIFIREWRGYKELMETIPGIAQHDSAERTEFDRDLALGYLEIISIAMDDFDVDRADEALSKLMEISLPEEMKSDMIRLQAYIADVDDDGCREVIEKIKMHMG